VRLSGSEPTEHGLHPSTARSQRAGA
jgi:hypothetical protein